MPSLSCVAMYFEVALVDHWLAANTNRGRRNPRVLVAVIAGVTEFEVNSSFNMAHLTPWKTGHLTAPYDTLDHQ